MPITKIEVAAEEICAAIRLYFEGQAPIAVHVLANAALDITNDIGRKMGIQTAEKGLKGLVQPDYVGVAADALRAPYNFMKHGSRDPDETFNQFHEELNVFVIMLAISNYAKIRPGMPVEMGYFSGWAGARDPAILRSPMMTGWADLTDFARRTDPDFKGAPMLEAIQRAYREGRSEV